jgi:hypothetical protein
VYTLRAEGGGTGPITYGMVETDKFIVDRATGEVKLRRLLDYEVQCAVTKITQGHICNLGYSFCT